MATLVRFDPLREVGPEEYRVSLRSKGNINVARIAEIFGGGGHKNAAGCRATGNWDESEARLVSAVREAVDAAMADWPFAELEPEMSLS